MTQRQTKRPGDVTGRQAQVLAEQNKEALKAREGEIALFNAAEADKKSNEVVDLTKPAEPEIVEAPVVEVEVATREFRVNTELQDMTFGVGNHFSFEEGVKYRAPKALYDHLDALGYIWH